MRRAVLAGLLALPVHAFAQTSAISVENAWSRAAMAGRTGVAYLTIKDSGAPDRLTAVSSGIADRAELHESYTEQGIAKMRPVASLPVTSDKPAVLAPNGYHIMLMGLKQTLKPDDSFPLTLSFEKAPPMTVTVTVQQSGGAMLPGAHMGGMPMHQ